MGTKSRSLSAIPRIGPIHVFGATLVIGLIAFSPLLQHAFNTGPLAFLCILPLMWAALRHDQRDTATTALILAAFAVWGALAGSGPFARSNLNDAFLLLSAFMNFISVPSLALSADVATRERHERHIKDICLSFHIARKTSSRLCKASLAKWRGVRKILRTLMMHFSAHSRLGECA